jgi:hypothetical protein
VPVPSADDVLRDSAREAGLPAHVTLLYPFLTTRAIGSDTELSLCSLARASSSFQSCSFAASIAALRLALAASRTLALPWHQLHG